MFSIFTIDDYIWDYLSNTGSEMDSTFDDISTSSDRAASTASSIASSSIVSLDKDQLHAAKNSGYEYAK
ncbi:hypothetical protein RCL_jg16152.t1 [Rhizophagus clarus]|uniref:Uncharacterized protein n=1 Tax=Rhizophagus clarus TaxID=94130 RepID=A0A8H3L7W0_9GLOM|nr:hypothetical protein RCL_jg16152.t1 [Rhizophagus clarus]